MLGTGFAPSNKRGRCEPCRSAPFVPVSRANVQRETFAARSLGRCQIQHGGKTVRFTAIQMQHDLVRVHLAGQGYGPVAIGQPCKAVEGGCLRSAIMGQSTAARPHSQQNPRCQSLAPHRSERGSGEGPETPSPISGRQVGIGPLHPFLEAASFAKPVLEIPIQL